MILVVILLRPVIIEPLPISEVVIPVIIDGSRSMSLIDETGIRRIDSAASIVQEQIMPNVGSEFAVEVFTFDGQLKPFESSDLMAEGRTSDLTDALFQVQNHYVTRTVAGVVLLSDGVDTSGNNINSTLESLSFPVYTIGVGESQQFVEVEAVSYTHLTLPTLLRV